MTEKAYEADSHHNDLSS